MQAGQDFEEGDLGSRRNSPNRRDLDQRISLDDDDSLATNKARQGVTGHNVRYVLFLSVAGAVIAFVIIYAAFFG